MDRVQQLITEYKSSSDEGDRSRLVDQLSNHLDDARAKDFLFRIVEGHARKNEVPRIAVINLLDWCPLESEADRDRAIAALTDRARRAAWDVERAHAVDAIARFLDDAEVRTFIHQILADPREEPSVRRTAAGSLTRHPPTKETVELCRRLRDDPEVGERVRLVLKQWGEK